MDWVTAGNYLWLVAGAVALFGVVFIIFLRKSPKEGDPTQRWITPTPSLTQLPLEPEPTQPQSVVEAMQELEAELTDQPTLPEDMTVDDLLLEYERMSMLPDLTRRLALLPKMAQQLREKVAKLEQLEVTFAEFKQVMLELVDEKNQLLSKQASTLTQQDEKLRRLVQQLETAQEALQRYQHPLHQTLTADPVAIQPPVEKVDPAPKIIPILYPKPQPIIGPEPVQIRPPVASPQQMQQIMEEVERELVATEQKNLLKRLVSGEAPFFPGEPPKKRDGTPLPPVLARSDDPPISRYRAKAKVTEGPWIYPKATYIPELMTSSKLTSPGNLPRGVVLRHTRSATLEATVRYMKTNQLDTHFLIGKDGRVVQLAPCDHITAHISGKTKWRKCEDLDKIFLGIGLVNMGPVRRDGKDKKFRDLYDYPYEGQVLERKTLGNLYWDAYPPAQEKSMIELLIWLLQSFRFEIDNVVGHYEIASGQVDPGGLGLGTVEDLRLKLKKSLKGLLI